MKPTDTFLKMAVSPLGLRALGYLDKKLKGEAVGRPILTENEQMELKKMESECLFLGQTSIRNIYKRFREEALEV